MAKRQRLRAMGTAGAGLAVLAALLVVPATVAGWSGSAQAAPYTGPQKIAFTDDEDGLYRVPLTRDMGNNAEIMVGQTQRVTTSGAEHEGEASSDDDRYSGRATAFVSTKIAADGPSDDDGEVYVTPRSDTGVRQPVAVTCDNDARETHPVVFVSSSSYEEESRRYTIFVAYASDADGDWDIYVASQQVEVTGQVDSPLDLLTGKCGSWNYRKVTQDPSGGRVDDRWPAYLPDGTGMVYSRTTPSRPLGDLYLRMFGDDGDDTETQLTTDGSGAKEVADTQPAVEFMRDSFSNAQKTYVAFTTTAFAPQGSIALVCVCDVTEPDPEPRIDLGPQVYGAREPAWSTSDENGRLLYTTTDRDPYGDIDMAFVNGPTRTTGPNEQPIYVDPELNSEPPIHIAHDPGVAETHPTFEDDLSFNPYDLEGAVLYTARSTDADIADVVAADGSDRQTRIASTFFNEFIDDDVPEDDARPDYNADGSKIAYSSQVRSGDGEDGGREIRISSTAYGDGTGATAVEAGRQIFDYDIDPVFSPAGNQIAFSRYRANPNGYDAPVIVVADLDTGTFREVEPGVRTSDLDPEWSPDGKRIVFSRTGTGFDDSRSSVRRPGLPNGSNVNGNANGDPRLFVVPAAGGTPQELGYTCGGEKCSVYGRQPAWSPDGSTIVYTAADALRSVALSGPQTTTVDTTEPAAVTGFAADRTPMPSRAQLSVAEDPAWSPDGSEIAFAGQPAGQPDDRGIYAIKPDGSGVRRVTDDHGPDTEPTWTPVSRVVLEQQADVAVSLEYANPALDELGLDPATGYVGNKTHVLLVDVENRSPSTTAIGVTLKLAYPPTTPSEAPEPDEPVFTPKSPQPCLEGTGTCLLGSIAPGDTRTFEVPLRLLKAGTASVKAAVTTTTTDPVPANNKDAAELEVLQPSVRLLPAVARPGRVTLVYGENMPPGSSIDLGWLQGITINRGPFEVDDDGTMRQPLLIVRHDLLGVRSLEAASVTPGSPAAPPLFSPVEGPMLVTERTAQVPDFLGRG